MLRDRAVVGGLVLGLLAGGAGLTGCGKSGYQFVENEDLGVYAKLPDDWAVYDERDLLATTTDAEISPEEADRLIGDVWFRGFDASDDPSLTAVTSTLTGDEPHGFVKVQPLSATGRDKANLELLRLLPTNGQIPISVTSQTDGVNVLLDEPVAFDGGFNGVHTVVALDGVGDEVAMLDQTVVLDSTSSTAYMFLVACDRRCYLETHGDEIQDLVDSWTIQEDGR